VGEWHRHGSVIGPGHGLIRHMQIMALREDPARYLTLYIYQSCPPYFEEAYGIVHKCVYVYMYNTYICMMCVHC
jgi:hypothetical protein